ncbi:hypothetical protein KF913_00485 [Candidatus Obscuribacterales bacterium]|nr:hypothetical protein [Candidatus Obscuribacterales bacterium]
MRPLSYTYTGVEEKLEVYAVSENDMVHGPTSTAEWGDEYFKDLRGKQVKSVQLYAMRLEGWSQYLKKSQSKSLICGI